MNIVDWLKSKSELTLTNENSYETIVIERGASIDDDWEDVEFIPKELMRADLYIMLFTFPSQVTRSLNSQGFNQSESWQNGKRERFLDLALGIYKRFDPDKYEEFSSQQSVVGSFKTKHKW